MEMQYQEQRQQYLSRNRTRIWMVVVLTAVTFFLLGWFFISFGQKITMREIESELDGKIATASALINQFLSAFSNIREDEYGVMARPVSNGTESYCGFSDSRSR